MKHLTALLALVLAAMLLAVSCGGDDDTDGSNGTEDAASANAAEAPASFDEAAMQLDAEDVKFAVDSFTVPPGDITIGLEQKGSMQHSFVIEGKEDDLRLVVTSPGEVDLGAINLPEGAYVFYCDIAGHRGLGMEGNLYVLDSGQ